MYSIVYRDEKKSKIENDEYKVWDKYFAKQKKGKKLGKPNKVLLVLGQIKKAYVLMQINFPPLYPLKHTNF